MNETIHAGAPRQKWQHTAMAALPIVLLTWIVYLPALNAGFVWDDDRYVTQNPLLSAQDGLHRIWFSKHIQSQYFPLVYTTLRFEFALWGTNPTGYHVVNILLHTANALLIWAVLRRLAIPGAWFAAALFALHPVQVETVAWVSELKNTQSTLFYLLALLAWLKFLNNGAKRSWLWYALALVLQAAALLAKTTACTLCVALLLVMWLRRQPITWSRVLQILPFCVLSVGAGLVTVWWEGYLQNYAAESGSAFGWLERLLIASRALWFYAGKLFWPQHLAFSYAHWSINPRGMTQYIWLLALLVLGGFVWWRRKAIPRGAIVAILFFVAVLSPVSGFIWIYTFRYTFVADHYQYLACASLLALFAGATAHIMRNWNSRTRFALCSVLLVALGFLTSRQTSYYRNSETLWRATLAANPKSFLAHNNLGLILRDQRNVTEAEAHYRAAISLNADYPEAWNNLGQLLAMRGESQQALECYQRALKSKPGFFEALNNSGTALSDLKQYDAAVTQLRRALEFAPNLPEAHNNLAVVLRRQGKLSEAVVSHQRAIQLLPRHPDFHYSYAVTLAEQRDLPAARQQFEVALQFDPRHSAAHRNLAQILAVQGDVDGAIDHNLQALFLSPDQTALHFILADLYLRKGTTNQAKIHYLAGLQTNPENASAHFNLGLILVTEKNTAQAVSHWREVVRLNPDDLRALNSLAWLLATTKDASLRDGKAAVEYGERAAKLAPTQPAILDTLAAVYAEVGRFNDAEETARKALEMISASGTSALAETIRSHLDEFRKGRPIRE